MSNKTEEQQHDLQHEIATKRPTVEELLKMLSGGSSSASSSNRPSPPPVPPKPRPGFEMSIEAAKRSLGLLPDPKKISKTQAPESNKSANRTFVVNSSGGGDDVDHDDVVDSRVLPDPIRKHDISARGSRVGSSSPNTRLDGYYENNHPPAAALPATTVTKITASNRTKPSPYGGSVVYISSQSAPPSQQNENISSARQQPISLAARSNGDHKNLRSSTHTSKPIVTELPDTEANNNNVIRQERQLGQTNNNTSTVEILELPGVSGGQYSSSRDIHGYPTSRATTGGNKHQQATREQQYSESPNAHRNVRAADDSAFAVTNLVVVSTTDQHNEGSFDDCRDNANGGSSGGGEDIQLAKEVETILSNSLSGSDDQPPRTSTPTPTAELLKRQYQRADSATNSSSGASTATNNNNNRLHLNRSSHLHNANYISQTSTSLNTIDSNNQASDNNDETDILDISHDTDELANTSAHNQSGCELVGVNDNSDPKDSSPRKLEPAQRQLQAATSQQDLTTPYTVQFFNDTLLSPSGSSSSPPEHSSSNNNNNNSQQSSTEALNSNNKSSTRSSRAYEMSIHELESNSLRKLVNTLQVQIEKLNNKVSGLSSKVEDLESELDRQKQSDDGATIRSSKSTASIFASAGNGTGRQDSSATSYHQSPMGTMQKLSPLSQSVSTINKVTPLKTSSSRLNTSYGFTSSTYSRNGQPQQQQPSTSSNLLSAKRSQAHLNQSYAGGGSISRQGAQATRRSNNMHTSTNSLYADSSRSPGSASISPTPMDGSTLGNRAHIASRDCYASPSSSSYLNHTQTATRRGDATPSAYNSMLSLTSAGNSTLRGGGGGGSMAGSVSNLSQFGTATASQLSNWPSMSNFITSKHQAKDILYDDEEQVIRMVLYNTLITMRVPTWLGAQDYSLDRIIEAPAVRLKLDWVHGYRGRDCRSNIYYLPTGECVYFVASVVILYNPEEKTQRHYLGHTDSVKCLAVHPNKLIVASGQSAIANRRDKRPIVRVWNTVSLATLRVIGFNEDFDRSICCLAFSKHDAGATLAVVDESSEHTITLLDWQREKNWRVAEANSGHEPVLAIDFHPIDKYSLVAVGKSSINFWDIRGMTLAKKAGLFDKYDRPKYVLCMTFNDLGETITGDSNGNIIIWPRGTNKPRRIIRDTHPGGVFSVLAMKDGSYLTGGRDRRIVEWDESFEPTGRQAELPEHCGGVRFITCARGAQVFIGTLRNSILLGSLDSAGFQIIVQGHTEATTALAIHPSLPKYLTGGFDDQIQFLDAETHTLEWSKCLAMPMTAASFSPNGQILILGSTSGSWLALDAITQEILFTACDGTGTINCIKFSPDGELFAMGSSDCHVYIYQTTPSGNTFCRLGTCVGHSAPIKEIDWSDDSAHLQSQSMNFELLFWKAHNCRPVDSGDDLVHDLKWTTHNCTIGFNVIGIWSDSIDSALINYCDKSNNDKYIVSATDTGFLSIYKWPTYYNQCSSQKYYGNVDKFTFIKFLSDDSKLIGVDAKSCATTEWSIIEDED